MTNREAAKILRRENCWDNDDQVLAKRLGADALDKLTRLQEQEGIAEEEVRGMEAECCKNCVSLTETGGCCQYNRCARWRKWFREEWEAIREAAARIKGKRKKEEPSDEPTA